MLSHYLRSIKFACILSQHFDVEITFLRSLHYNHFVDNKGFKTSSTGISFFKNVIQSAAQFNFSWINLKSVKQTVDELLRIVEDEKPDILITDTFLGAKIVAEKLNIPHIALLNAYATNYYAAFRDVPHHHQGNRLKKYVSQQQWERIVKTIENITLKQVHSPFRIIRKQWQLAAVHNLFDEFTGITNLLCDDKEIFPLHGKPNNFHYIGPLLYECNQHDIELEQFIKHNQRKPIIYVTSGSSGKKNYP